MDFISYISEKYNMSLNEQQQKAVLHVDGPALAIACPGAGKTTVVVCRNANLVLNHNIDPSSILTLTFSNSAARDMSSRFNSLFGQDIPEGMKYSTIHSFCRSVIYKYCKTNKKDFPEVIEGIDVNTENEITDATTLQSLNFKEKKIHKSGILKQIYKEINKDYITEDKLDDLVNAISYIKNVMIPPDKLDSDEIEIKNFTDIYHSYENFKKKNKCIDFDDMLVHALTILKKDRELLKHYRQRYLYINIDESQDTSKIQNEIIKLLVNPQNNIFMVGDLDQSIYMFRGAEPRQLLQFEETYPGAKIYYMDQNFRSTSSIVYLANRFIKQNEERFDKDMYTNKVEGNPVQYNVFTEKQEQYTYLLEVIKAERIMSDVAILYRNNVSSLPVIDLFDRNDIPFYVRDFKTSIFKHPVTQDIISFLEFALDQSNLAAFEKIYYKMNAYISKAAVEYVKANRVPGKSVIDILMQNPDILYKQKSTLSDLNTAFKLITQSKGKRLIDHIGSSLNYEEYLKNKAKESGKNASNNLLVLNTLKTISSGVEGAKDFIYRLGNLEMAIKNAKKNKGKNAVTLTTIHSSKGLEFKKVYMIDLIDEQFPSKDSIDELKEGNRSLFEEEVRLFYVGATRAKEHLELITASHCEGSIIRPSRFIGNFMNIKNKVNTNNLAKNSMASDTVNDIIINTNIGVGSRMWHTKYGNGVLKRLDGNIVEVSFPGHGVKKLALDICIKGNLLKIVSE